MPLLTWPTQNSSHCRCTTAKSFCALSGRRGVSRRGIESFLRFALCAPIVGARLCRLHSENGLTMNPILRIGVALGFFLLLVMSAEAAPTYCEAEVRERLDRLNVGASDISGINYELQRTGSRNKSNRILAWVSLHSCKGYVIIDLSKHCIVREVYGRGECNLGGAVKPW